MSELNERVTLIDGFSALGHADKIRFFAWYLHEAEGKDAFEQKHITECYALLGMQRPPGGIAPYLLKMADRKPPELLRRNGRYELERRARESLAAKYGREPALIQIDKLVAQLPQQLSNPAERVFLEEMLICLRHGAFRSCVVMAWNLAYNHLCEYVLANKLSDFNTQLPKSYPKASIAAITKYDDFAVLKEFEVLKVCKSSNITSASVDKILGEKLARRNTAAHPLGRFCLAADRAGDNCGSRGERRPEVLANRLEVAMGDSVVNMSVSLNSTSDGFISQECPACERIFKVAPGKGSPEPVTHCPYCNHEGKGCWWTKEQVSYLQAFAANKVVGPQLDDMARRFNRRSGSNDLIKMSMKVTNPEVPPAPEERDDMPASITFSCCAETIRYDGGTLQLHCPICGQMQAA